MAHRRSKSGEAAPTELFSTPMNLYRLSSSRPSAKKELEGFSDTIYETFVKVIPFLMNARGAIFTQYPALFISCLT